MATDLDVVAADRLLSTTRTVRRRLDLDRDVPQTLLLECVALAQQAPTAVNRQNWHWLIVTDAVRRAAIGDIYRTLSHQFADAVAGHHVDRQSERVHESVQYLAEIIDQVPAHVIPCLRPDAPFPMQHVMAAPTYGSIFPAVWSFQLAARARGLGTALTTLHLASEREIAEMLGIPAAWRQVALLPTAFYTGDTFRPADRPDPDTITSWNEWDAKP